MTKQFGAAFRAAGVPNASLRAALYNDNGKLIAFEVNLGNPEKYGRGRHLLFIHPANDIGGGKSDESLTDGRLTFQTSTLDVNLNGGRLHSNSVTAELDQSKRPSVELLDSVAMLSSLLEFLGRCSPRMPLKFSM